MHRNTSPQGNSDEPVTLRLDQLAPLSNLQVGMQSTLLHGGASVVLAETLGSFGAALHAGPERIAVGIEVSASHHRAAVEGFVTGVATPISLGRTAATYEIVITDDEGRRTCTARLTCLLRDRPPA